MSLFIDFILKLSFQWDHRIDDGSVGGLTLVVLFYLYRSKMPVHYWEDELMYYAEESYIDSFLNNITSTFGIVNMDE